MNQNDKKIISQLIEKKSYQEAYTALRELLDKHPEDWEIYDSMAFLEMELNETYEGAFDFLKKALAYGCPKGRYHRVYGDILWLQGQLRPATLEYEKAVKENRSSHNLTSWAKSLMKTDYQRAESVWRELLSEDPNNALAYKGLAWIANKQKDWQKALKMAQKADELQPDNSDILCQIGRAYKGLNQHEQAYKIFHQALNADTEDWTIYINIANYEITLKGNLEKATDLLKKALEYGCPKDGYHIVCGDIFWKKGELRQATSEYEKAVDINRSIENLNALAQALATIEDDRAVSILQEVLQRDSANIRAFKGVTYIAMERSEWDDALEMLFKANEIKLEDPEILYGISYIYHKINKPELAEKYYNEAVKNGYSPVQ